MKPSEYEKIGMRDPSAGTFVRKLYDMVEHEPREVICWVRGKSIE